MTFSVSIPVFNVLRKIFEMLRLTEEVRLVCCDSIDEMEALLGSGVGVK
jgi:hypothetical protein